MNAQPRREERSLGDEGTRREQRPPERIVLSAQDARQGEIILGKVGRWVWIGAFAAIMLFALVLSYWA